MSEVSFTNLYFEFFRRRTHGLVDNLVDSHCDGATVLKYQRVGARPQCGFDNSLTPVVLSNLLKADVLSCAIDSSLHLTGLITITVSDTDIILTTLIQLQIMTQGTVRIGLCLNKAQTSEVLVVLCPPARVGQFVVNILTIHILGLNNDASFERFRLFGRL